MIRILFILSLFNFFACNHPERKEYNRFKETTRSNNSLNKTDGYQVITIKDGDTFVVLIDGKEQVIRLEHIDCPEKKQPFGTTAKQFASQLCFGKKVYLKQNMKYDRYGRLIAEVILDNGTNINKELLINGLAWHFKKYSDNNEYAELEKFAQRNQIGIWSEANPTAPWDWRKKQQSRNTK